MKTRVVVTGMGAITPIGNSVESFWQAVKEKTVGIGPITYFDTTDFKCKLAAEVKGFDPKQYMDPKAARRMEAFSQFAVAAAKEALEQSGLAMEKEDPYRVGVSIGSGIGSLQAMERDVKKLNEKDPAGKSPSGSPDDLQYGGRKCGDPVWIKGQMHQCGDGLCYGNSLHRGSIPLDSVRRGRRNAGGRNRGQHHSYRNCRIYCSYSS